MCDVSQLSNQVWDISLCTRRDLLGLFTTFNDPTGLWVLPPGHSLFDEIKPRVSKSTVILSKTKGRLLIVYSISVAKVSHCSTEILCFQNPS